MVFSSLTALKFLVEDCERSSALCLEVQLCATCRAESAVLCPSWECCVSGTGTLALIKLVPTRLCLGLRAQILYNMETGIHTHITHIYKTILRLRERLILLFTTVKAVNFSQQ